MPHPARYRGPRGAAGTRLSGANTPGRIEAVESVELRPRVSGYLTEARFQPGSLVKQGDVLFVIDPRPYQAAADKAGGELKRAEAAAIGQAGI